MSLIDSPAFHLSHSSFLRTADNPGRPGLAMPIPPIRPTQKTLPCCTDRLNLPCPTLLITTHTTHIPASGRRRLLHGFSSSPTCCPNGDASGHGRMYLAVVGKGSC